MFAARRSQLFTESGKSLTAFSAWRCGEKANLIRWAVRAHILSCVSAGVEGHC
jgi:hypothetical protein